MNFKLWNRLSFLIVVVCSVFFVVFVGVCYCVVEEIKMLDEMEIEIDTCTRSSF